MVLANLPSALFDLAFHAGNLLDPATLQEKIDFSDVRLLTDDYAPVDTLAFDVAPAALARQDT